MSEATNELLVERDGGCWTVTLNRPQAANALSASLVEALIAAVDEAEAARADVLVFKGAGRNFSAGFDFANLEAHSEAELLQRFVRIEQLLQAVARSSCLTVACAHGRNFGAGVDLNAACRWRVAEETASFRMPGLAFGIVLGTRRFAAIVGRDAAREILESLRTFGATEARALGFVRRVALADEWPAVIAQAREAAGQLAREQRATLYRTLHDAQDDADLASLVRSAAAPGLKQRMREYQAAQQRARAKT